MNIAKEQVHKNKERLPLVFLIAAGIAALNTFLRPDYNLVIYLYLYYVFTMMNNVKVKFYYSLFKFNS